MANRYDIVRIDFQASARGANAAIESLRKEAEKSSAKLNEMRDNIDKAFKAGESDEVIAGKRAEAKAEERRYNQLTQAQNELIKGMRVLDQGVKMFNDGSLNQMNAAFQKAVNSAAKLAQSKMDAGSDTWRQMGALMQETEQNYARMQRDTEQLVQVIQNGGTVFKNTLEQEKKGLQELMGLVPYMGTEYQRLEGYLQTVTAKLEQMTIAERQHRGEIATTNDARRVSYQLTEEGAAAAKREAEAAEQTIAAGKQRIALLEEERSKRESAARATAEAVAKRNEDLAMQEGVIKSLEKEIQNEDRKGKKKRKDAAVAKKAAEESAKAVDTEKAALEGLQATTKAADEKVKQLEEDLKKLELAEQQQTSSQQLKKGIETLTGDINSLSDAIKALKDQRDALTASQNQGAEAAAKDAKAIQMTKEEAQAARDEMIKKSSIHIKTNGDVDYSNLEEVQSFIISKINGNVNEKGLNTKPELAKKGVFQLENPNQVKNLVNMLRERYGIEEKSDAVNILKGLVSGKEGGIFGKGFVDMEAGQLKIQTNEKRGERIARMKELNAIIKGTTQATEQHTAAIEKNAEEEKRQVEVEQQKAALSAQITALEEQRQQKQEQLNQLQQQATQTSASQTNSIESLAEEEKKLIQLQKELKQAMTDAGYADKSPDKIDVFASMNRSARTGLMNEAAHSRIWAHHFGGDSPMKDWVEGHAKTLAERDSYFTALSKETIKDSLSGYLTNNKTLADVKAMQAEWKKVASSFTNNPETNKGYYQDAVLYIDRLVEKTAQLKEIQEKRSAVKNQQAIVDGLKQQAESTEKTTQATEQSADADKKAVELTNQLTDAKKELATAQQNQEAQQKKVDEAIAKANSDKEKSVKMEEELAKASADKTAELEKEKKTLVEMEAAAQKDVEQNNKRQEELRKTNEQIAAEGNIIREAETKKVQAQTNSIKATEEAIRLLREENNTIQFNSEQWRKNAADIQRLEAALDKMKGQAALQMMTDRMGQVSRLSSSALTETKRFWETMVAGAEKGSQELKVFEGNLKVIAEEERQRNRAALETSAKRLNGGMGNLSQEELRQAINDAKLLQSSYKSTSKEAQELASAIVDAEEHVKRYGVEAERAARKQEESDKRTARAARDKEEAEFQEQQSQQALMRQRIAERTSLSAAALVETKKYWQAVKDGAQAGTIEEEKAMQVMRMITAEEQRRATIANEAQAGILSGNLSTYSEQEVRAAIEAGKQLIQTYKVGSDEANTLAKNIVNAEEYIKQYGVEAERAAVREAKAIEEANRKRQETNQLMEQQLQRDTGLSQSALKAQENYWQRLIDDPKAAANELAYYYEQLNKVHRIQEEQASMKVTAGGISVLQRMRSDVDYESKISDDQRKKDLAALKAYRDALPKEGNASVLKEIDYYLGQLGATAKEGAQAVMSLADAEVLAGKLGTKGFSASTNQLQQAKKALIDAQQAAGRGTPRFTELQNAINKVNLEIGKTGEITADVQAVLDKPKGQSLNALKQAVEQGRAALQNMDRTTQKGQDAFDELAKKIKETELELKRMSGEARATTSAFEKAWSRLKTYVGLYVGASVAMNKLVGTMGDLMELSDKLGEVRKTTGFTADEVGRLSENLKKMDTRTSITGLLDLSVAAGQLGLKTQEDVQGFTEAANKLMVALPEMGREGATEMLKVALATGEIDKIRKQMEQGLIDGSSATAVAMEKVGSTIDRLRATSAATAPAITDFVKRVGAVGAQSGITIDQVAALGSTVDALGMRVEMSATALSRMIPAIKNNAFDVAKAIGVAPETLRSLFDAGRGMEAILMIFQHIKDSGMGEDSIEKMLGMGSMKEIMKELNQQGARAGIVFAGLSQNVDELRRQLGIASTAYEENIAIEQEYQKMNETTAARWERLKNQLEETFVGDDSQRALGWIIDRLRNIIDLLTGSGSVSVALRTIITYLGLVRLQLVSIAAGALKGIGTGLRNVGVMLGFVKGEMTKLQWGNIFTAAAGAVIYLLYSLKDLVNATSAAKKAIAEANNETEKATFRFYGYYTALVDTRKALLSARSEHSLLSAEVDKLRKSTDGSAAATAKLNEKQEMLEKSERKVAKASNDHRGAIANMNSIYGQYLGFLLTEYDRAELVAAAHDKVTAAIRREMLAKQQQAALDKIDDKYTEDLAEDLGGLSEELTKQGRLNLQQAAKAKRDLQKFMRENISYNQQTGKYTYTKSSASQLRGLDLSGAGINDIVALWFDNYLKSNFHLDAQARSSITGVSTRVKDGRNEWQRIYTPFHSNLRSDYASTYNDRLKEQTEITDLFTGELSDAVEQDEKSTKRIVEELKRKASDASARIANAKKGENTGKAYEDLASALEGLDRNIGQLDPVRNAQLIKSVTAQAENLTKTVDAGQLSAARTRVSSLFSRATGNTVTNGAGNRERPFGGTGTPSTNIWGRNASAESTDYATWDVNELVARRNQMDKFKNILKPDTDIRAVLAEDKALMKALDNGLKEDWKSVLGWYNTERKKIQQELKSERFSTNEGHWRDEKNGRGRRNPLVESDYALAELDRYYSRRKEALEKARSEENISEELYNRQLEMMEQEHLERRSKLRGTFTGEVSKAETAAFRKWWENLEKMDELDHVPWATVESEWSKATAAQIGRNNLKMQQDMTQVESITMKHVNQIAKIIAKERPYDGITENLQANLTRMDILFADMGAVTKKQLEDGSLTKELSRRLSFLLGEAEHAYTLTVDQLDRDMREKGFTAWADALSGEDGNELKRQMLAQLQTAYDAVQDAVKKEATLIKKQAEIQWNDTVLANGQSQKQAFESTLSALGLQEDQVKRANSLIGAGQASERIADKLAIKQMQVRLAMQEQYYALIRKIGSERIAQLEAAGKLEDAEHLRKSLNLALSEEQKKLDEQRVGIANQLEESQNRLYTELRSWADLLASSMRSLFEASHAGDAEYYNERAKLNLTGKGGPGAGTYVVIDNEGTSDAKAHYEYLNEREALDRQREIERQNALAEAWRKVMDDINMKMSETITDIMNATLQNASVDTNTDALDLNTSALGKLTGAVSTLAGAVASGGSGSAADLPAADDSNPDTWPRARRKRAGLPVDENPHDFTGSENGGASPVFLNPEEAGSISWVYDEVSQAAETSALRQVESLNKVDYALEQHFHKQVQGSADAGTKMAAGTQSAFAKMTQAANLYGIAYQAMSNDNLSATQKFEMIAIQAAGQAAITSLTTSGVKMVGDTAVQTPSVLSKIMAELGPIAGPVAFGAFTALLGGLMGLAMSKLTKAKSQIASVTGAGSVGAGRLSTGMLTYAAGNVNEFTDPATLTPGRTYNVDAADGKTYRAKYTGKNPRTHITNGPEFHLAGEAGREAIIDARTTRHITMNEGEIWRTIQTLSAGGRIRHSARRGGVAAFADGNIDDFDGIASNVAAGGMSTEQAAALQASIDRQNDLLERALTDGIKGVFDVHGPEGLVASYDKGKRMAQRHGEKY